MYALEASSTTNIMQISSGKRRTIAAAVSAMLVPLDLCRPMMTSLQTQPFSASKTVNLVTEARDPQPVFLFLGFHFQQDNWTFVLARLARPFFSLDAYPTDTFPHLGR